MPSVIAALNYFLTYSSREETVRFGSFKIIDKGIREVWCLASRKAYNVQYMNTFPSILILRSIKRDAAVENRNVDKGKKNKVCEASLPSW
jgi:hypothetical protein